MSRFKQGAEFCNLSTTVVLLRSNQAFKSVRGVWYLMSPTGGTAAVPARVRCCTCTAVLYFEYITYAAVSIMILVRKYRCCCGALRVKPTATPVLTTSNVTAALQGFLVYMRAAAVYLILCQHAVRSTSYRLGAWCQIPVLLLHVQLKTMYDNCCHQRDQTVFEPYDWYESITSCYCCMLRIVQQQHRAPAPAPASTCAGGCAYVHLTLLNFGPICSGRQSPPFGVCGRISRGHSWRAVTHRGVPFYLLRLPSALLALFFIARDLQVQPFVSVVEVGIELFCVLAK